MEYCYLILFELKRPLKNYDNFYKAMKEYGTWGRLTKSTWAIISYDSPSQIRDYLSQFIAKGDRLIIVKSGGRAAWKNSIADNDWMKNNLPLT